MPTFLYPFVHEYPVDEVCEKIVRALEERKWKVEGIRVAFGHNSQKDQFVQHISGKDFRLWFCRRQGESSDNVDYAAVGQIVIPHHGITLYSDYSGPTYYRYVGNEWEAHRDLFMNPIKVNFKLNNKPRIYLRYSGSATGGAMLVHDDDGGAEYGLQRGDVGSYETNDILEEIRDWLT